MLGILSAQIYDFKIVLQGFCDVEVWENTLAMSLSALVPGCQDPQETWR